MLAELLEQDHGKKAGAGEAARRHMERRGRLRNRLALSAGEALADRLYHLPMARNDLERLRDILAELRKLRRRIGAGSSSLFSPGGSRKRYIAGYDSEDEACAALTKFVSLTGLPEPTMIVATGDELQVYWAFAEVFSPASSTSYQSRWRALAGCSV
jgi:hypothetical protein